MKILIEADSQGLTSQLKRATASVTSFVGSMNKQEVNWTKILSSTISPAIIGGIASSFALAITEAVGFQNSMIQAANTSSTAFTDNMAQAGAAALGLQSTTGQSASDIAQGLGIATKALGSYAAGQSLVTEASKFSLTTGIDLLTLINLLIPAMQQWGITDAGQITTTIQNLFGVADQGKVTIQNLLTTMADTGSVLKGKTDINSAAAALEALSNQAGMTASTAKDTFTIIANNTQNIATAASNTALGMGSWNDQNKILKDSGMAGLLDKMETSLFKMGTNTASILLNHAGFSATDTANIVTADKSYGTLVTSTKKIADNMATLGKNIEDNLSDLEKLKVALGTIKTDLTGLGNFFAQTATNVLGGVDAVLHPYKTENTLSNLFQGDKMDPANQVLNLFKNLFGSGAFGSQGGTNNQSNNSTVNNTVIQNIAPQAVGQGVNSTGKANAQYLGVFGYLTPGMFQ